MVNQKTNKPTSEQSERAAREFIDNIVAINKRHGMTSHLPKKRYNQAVERTARLTEKLHQQALTRKD